MEIYKMRKMRMLALRFHSSIIKTVRGFRRGHKGLTSEYFHHYGCFPVCSSLMTS